MKLGFSSCPNDTFIFDAIANRKIDTENIEFELVIEDVEELNKKALHSELDISKLSFQTYFNVKQYYELLSSGSALGKNCGPILISNKKFNLNEINDLKIAIPGRNTTANLLMTLAFPQAKNKIEILFSEIEEAILVNQVDVGVIIHESRFTYEEKGLSKLLDLGEYWEKITGCPLPLGCIVVKKDLSQDMKDKINRVLRRSVAFALNNPDSSSEYIKSFAQEMNDDVIKKHINLYVNDFTVDLGETGHMAINRLEEYYLTIINYK